MATTGPNLDRPDQYHAVDDSGVDKFLVDTVVHAPFPPSHATRWASVPPDLAAELLVLANNAEAGAIGEREAVLQAASLVNEVYYRRDLLRSVGTITIGEPEVAEITGKESELPPAA